MSGNLAVSTINGVDISVSPVATQAYTKGVFSFSSNGYAQLPSGLFIQWGVYSGATNGTVTFPIAFPNACLSVTITARNTGAVCLNNITPSTTSFYWRDTAVAENTGIRWTAVGY